MNDFFKKLKVDLEAAGGIDCLGIDHMQFKDIRLIIHPHKKTLLKNVSKSLDESLYLSGFKDYFVYDVS
jgi:hypothetical protein